MHPRSHFDNRAYGQFCFSPVSVREEGFPRVLVWNLGGSSFAVPGFGSRLVLLLVAFVLFASMTRLWFYDKEISLGTTLKIGIVLAVAALFFVYVQGNRDLWS